MRKSRPLPMTPPPPPKGMTAKVFLDDIVSKDTESKGTVISLPLSDAESKRNWVIFFFMTWAIEMAAWTCFLGYVFSLVTAALTSKQFCRSCFSSTGDSGYYSPKPQHMNMTYDTKCSRTPMIAVTPLHIISVSRSWIILKCWHKLFFCNLKYKGLKKNY